MLALIVLALMVFIPVEASDYFCNPKVINKVHQNTAIVATYFKAGYEDYYGKWVVNYKVNYGAGVMVKDNHIITVSHVLEHDGMEIDNIYVIFPGMREWIKCDMIAIGESIPSWKDYAVIKTREKVDLPGLKIARKHLEKLQKVIWCGTPDGAAFFIRAGYVTHLTYFIHVNDNSALEFTNFFDFYNVAVHPGYGGDSGGVIANTKGEIQSIMYFGVQGRPYVFGNPVSKLWEFLEEHDLVHLGR
jgi:hypothetical protein